MNFKDLLEEVLNESKQNRWIFYTINNMPYLKMIGITEHVHYAVRQESIKTYIRANKSEFPVILEVIGYSPDKDTTNEKLTTNGSFYFKALTELIDSKGLNFIRITKEDNILEDKMLQLETKVPWKKILNFASNDREFAQIFLDVKDDEDIRLRKSLMDKGKYLDEETIQAIQKKLRG